MTTWFWADNSNKNVDKETGGGAIDMTTIRAFQEESFGAIQGDRAVNVPKTYSRTITVVCEEQSMKYSAVL